MSAFHPWIKYICIVLILCLVCGQKSKHCTTKEESCDSKEHIKYSKETNERHSKFMKEVEAALNDYVPFDGPNCTCYTSLIESDLFPFRSGITRQMIDSAKDKGVKYQILGHRLYREREVLFPFRCSGVEHFILSIINDLPDMEFVLNTRDWPQVHKHFGSSVPVFSFSKTGDYLDITYPAWSFWEGGPAISLYPRGLGRWDQHRKSISAAAKEWPWSQKRRKAFFRGSRTSPERDPLVLLSRESPSLVDAHYTKNQAWKSDADTLNAPPAEEISLEDHCQYKYLFNYRGVAASFRLKHLFLCGSLVFHVGKEWTEFFYPALKPWVHYIPVPWDASKEQIRELITFAVENDGIAQDIAQRGRDFIWKHLQMKDVTCYWKTLLLSYAQLLRFKPSRDHSLIEVMQKMR